MGQELSKWYCSLSDPTPTTWKSGLPCPDITKGSAPYNVTHVLRQRNMAQIKEQIETPEKELSNEETANLTDAEFKTLVIIMPTEMIEYGCKIQKEVKAMLSAIKENI